MLSHIVGTQVMIQRGISAPSLTLTYMPSSRKTTHHIPYSIIISYEFGLESVQLTDLLLGV